MSFFGGIFNNGRATEAQQSTPLFNNQQHAQALQQLLIQQQVQTNTLFNRAIGNWEVIPSQNITYDNADVMISELREELLQKEGRIKYLESQLHIHKVPDPNPEQINDRFEILDL